MLTTAPALEFDQARHLYHLDGQLVPGVTGILRISGVVDFSSVPPSILEAARQRGMAVHQAIHYFNENDLDVGQFIGDFPDYAGYLESWIGLLDSGRLQAELCEIRVASRRYGYAGTIDWLGTVDGHAAVIDFASGNPEDCAKDLQTAGYIIAAQEWAKEPGQERLIAFLERHRFIARYSVRLRKDGSLPGMERYTDPRHLNDFLTLLSAYRIVDQRRPKTINLEDYAA